MFEHEYIHPLYPYQEPLSTGIIKKYPAQAGYFFISFLFVLEMEISLEEHFFSFLR